MQMTLNSIPSTKMMIVMMMMMMTKTDTYSLLDDWESTLKVYIEIIKVFIPFVFVLLILRSS